MSLDLPEESPIVYVDFLQMTRVLQSLLENALLYAGDATPVTVGARGWNEGTRLWVEDQGPGVPRRRTRGGVREVLSRPHRRRAGDLRHRGLGLAITREIVRSHGGSIGLEDVKPHGARFVIALPAMPARPDDSDEEGS